MVTAEKRWYVKSNEESTVDAALFPEAHVPADAHPRWERQRMVIQFRGSDIDNDPFDDETGIPLDYWPKKVYQQLCEDIDHVFPRQQRTALFVLLVSGTMARITRWDRSGTIFSDAFDFVENPVAMRDILWGFSLLSSEGQGLDPTAVLVEPGTEEYKTMDELARERPTDLALAEGTPVPDQAGDAGEPVFGYVRMMFAKSLRSPFWPRWKLSVPTTGGCKVYLVGMPITLSPGIIGRGTRGYVAVDWETKRFVWLKDTWRPNSPDATPEGDMLKALQDAHVRHVPVLECHGDLDQDALTSRYLYTSRGLRTDRSAGTKRRYGTDESPIEDTRYRFLRHYRLVVRDVYLRLERFTCGKQFVSLIRDAVLAHADAYNSPLRLLHRDISSGNIMIRPTIETQASGSRQVVWRGVLTDWELAKSLHDNGQDSQTRRQIERTGTLPFISAYALDHPLEPMKVEDELEAFFHVLLFFGVRYLKNNAPDVQRFVHFIFLSYETNWGMGGCGRGKSNMMRTGIVPAYGALRLKFLNGAENEQSPFNVLIGKALEWFRARYELVDNPGLRKRLEGAKSGEVEAPCISQVAKISNHTAFLDLFDELLAKEWPTGDKTKDQLDEDDEAQDVVAQLLLRAAPQVAAQQDQGRLSQLSGNGSGDGNEKATGVVGDACDERPTKRRAT
ncbi:hypothetical protein BD414DRAFT_424467 [Trametes punicea]|nr:hypothetical protein BD414DRAFT_424467 [Trametes punicea]